MAGHTKQPRGADAWAQLEYHRKKRTTLEGRIGAAWAGDTDLARELLKEAAFHLEPSAFAKMPPALGQYIGHALREIANGTDPAIALGLTVPKHKRQPPDYWRLERDADMARGVNYWRQEGMTLEAAAGKVAETYDGFKGLAGPAHSYEAVRKAYLRFYSKDLGKR
jgi:hypothetical protein